MSASNLVNPANNKLQVPCVLSKVAPAGLLASSGSQVQVLAVGEVNLAVGAGNQDVAYAGVLATDVCLVTSQSAATPANGAVAVSCQCQANNLRFVSNFATTGETVAFLVLRFA